MMLAAKKARPSASPCPPSEPDRAELARRMVRPQRHRLLQGYPMAPMLQPVSRGWVESEFIPAESDRPLLVGVLPHAACNPKVRGCGFCTFPHEKYDRAGVERVAAQVEREIRLVAGRNPGL